MLNVRNAQRAKTDLKSIWRYSFKKWGEVQADHYLAKLDDATSQLGRTPKIGTSRDKIKAGLRAYHVGRHLIYYYIRTDHIYVVRVRHDRTDPYLYEE